MRAGIARQTSVTVGEVQPSPRIRTKSGGTVARDLERLAAIIVNYQTPDDTIRAIDALRASRRAFDEIIVVDNGSSDESLVRVRAVAPAATVIASPTNLGFTGGNNLGIRAALSHAADAVLLVNSDAIVEPECVERLVEALAERTDAGIAGPSIVAHDDPTLVTSAGIRFSPTTGRVRTEEFGARLVRGETASRQVDAVSGAVMLVKREVFERTGLFDEAYFFSLEDVDFCLRARAAGFTTICVPASIARHVGSRTIGTRSPRKLYFATRNHLRLVSRVAPVRHPVRRFGRLAAILGVNLAYAALRTDAPRVRAVAAVMNGAWDHARGRYGDRCR